MAQEWHRGVYRGIDLPVPYYAGEVRDAAPRFPELIGYEVRVGPYPGVSSRDVPSQLALFQDHVQEAVARLDPAVAPGSAPGSGPLLQAVFNMCGGAHGEWIRIHPFANGNGRTARLWALWVAARYGLPPFIRLMPRPAGTLYAAAAAASMRGDHGPTVTVLHEMLRDWVRRRSSPADQNT
jgi:hypothetical protein